MGDVGLRCALNGGPEHYRIDSKSSKSARRDSVRAKSIACVHVRCLVRLLREYRSTKPRQLLGCRPPWPTEIFYERMGFDGRRFLPMDVGFPYTGVISLSLGGSRPLSKTKYSCGNPCTKPARSFRRLATIRRRYTRTHTHTHTHTHKQPIG